jgi:hypothetical protein
MKRFLLIACTAAVSLSLLAGCKPKSPPDSGKMGAIAGGVHDRAVQATDKVNKVRGEQNEAAEDAQHEASEAREGGHK